MCLLPCWMRAWHRLLWQSRPSRDWSLCCSKYPCSQVSLFHVNEQALTELDADISFVWKVLLPNMAGCCNPGKKQKASKSKTEGGSAPSTSNLSISTGIPTILWTADILVFRKLTALDLSWTILAKTPSACTTRRISYVRGFSFQLITQRLLVVSSSRPLMTSKCMSNFWSTTSPVQRSRSKTCFPLCRSRQKACGGGWGFCAEELKYNGVHAACCLNHMLGPARAQNNFLIQENWKEANVEYVPLQDSKRVRRVFQVWRE